ncbi:phospholipase D-like domain-containing protein [Pseudobacteriovorax antillogorgiicola]|uniref:phospholipase D n=1 Tax=Pseudobacteriovorax antillogorgiicola TaxID=1513793 RepID=A0A1Y6BJ23_9BACT|nr:phospholipase D-like domain-containing protein [Pseudobacteriovorax antillogorgiicola]TCS56359.1 phosphatidylserine/phosphatidylglycerophosphate/cardiolipin synthase-like enzyme [Pseudobacteriovorax antillogorgiicola]SMF06685.1 Phosphatidylserine/phosphatidylglycerophosphate/cardiolipin synthase [Pseudobacteriovorax antillogorgiicola]
MKLLRVLCLTAFLSTPAYSEVEVLFHPFDPTLEKAALWISEAQSSIDLAMYNLDVTDASPVIRMLKSDAIQSKISSGELKVRMIFEGYKGKSHATKLALGLEELGIDLRFLKSGRKVHHKFAVLDYNTDQPRVISGSANWSLGSRSNYNENILFMDDEQSMASRFQSEFNLLWSASEEVGEELVGNVNLFVPEAGEDPSLQVTMNSDNFRFSGLRVTRKSYDEGYVLTRELVRAIDSAKEKLEIATTRFKLRPVYDAVLRAAARGIKVQLLVNMDQYDPYQDRKKWTLPECQDPYLESCSASMNFSHFLDKLEFDGHENVEVRIKFFNLDPTAYLSRQMHSKYLIVDDQTVWTGSFNWSYSGEYSHIENLVKIQGGTHVEAVAGFNRDFAQLWDLNRSQYQEFKGRMIDALKNDKKTDCKFEPMALTFTEIDILLRMGWWYDKELKDACE